MAEAAPPQRDLLERLERPSLAAAATIVAAGFLGSRLLGLLRTVIIGASFGTGSDVATYWVAFRLPDLIFQLLAGATLGSAFIPVFARVFAREGEEKAWQLARSVLNLVTVATVVFALLGVLLAPVLVPIMAPGLGENTGQQAELRAQAVELTQIMMISPVLFAISGMFMGILNARQHFLWPAIAPMFYNISIIVGALMFDSVYALAIAVVIGAGLHLLVQVPALIGVGMRWRPVADWRDAAVREVGRLMAPRMLGLAAFQINLLVTVFFASMVSDQAISGVNYAFLIMLTPLGLVGMAIGTAVFPTMAAQAVEGFSEMRRTLEQSLRVTLFLTVPAAAGLMILSRPIVVVFFEHGEFNEISRQITQDALLFYAIGLPAHAAIEILSRGFYAMGDTRTPVSFALLSMVLNVILCATLVGPYEVRGLALALSIATTAEALLLAWAFRRRMEISDVRELGWSLGRTAVATILMAEVVGLYLIVLEQAGHLTTSFGDSFLALVGGSILGGATFLVVARALRSDEADMLIRRLPAPVRRALE